MTRVILRRVSVFFVLSLLLLYYFLEFGVSITAKALSGGRFMTPTETRAIFGDTIPAKYFNGTDYVDVNFTYTGTATLSTCDWVDSSGYFVQGRDVICYFVNNVRNVNSNANYITVDCTPTYSLFNFDTLYTNIGISNGQTQNIAAYQSPFWKWFIGDTEYTFEGSTAIPASGEFPHSVLSNSNRSYIFCPVEYHSQSLVSGYSYRAGFYGASHYNGAMFLYIACPYITDGASGDTGTYTTTTTDISQGGIDGSEIVSGINETNDILEEHSGLLADIIDFLHYIGECIAGDESEVSEVEPIETMENPPDWDDAMSQVESALDDIPDITASGGFIWALYNIIMSTSPVIKFLVPFGLMITLLSYIWWKK